MYKIHIMYNTLFSFWAVMDWFSRSDAENFALNVAFLKEHVRPLNSGGELPLVFSHVPKTAGTSFESFLASQYKMSESLHINAPDLNRLPEVINIKKNFPRLVCGHHPMHGLLYQLLPATPLHHITLLRNPVDRVLSYYNYVCGKTDHPMHTSAMSLGFEDFLDQAPSPELHNGQARRFAGQLHHTDLNETDLLETATTVLNDCFSAVFTTSRLNEAINTLHNDLGFENKPLAKANQSVKRIIRDDLTTTQLKAIENHNSVDMELFKRFV